MRKLSQKNLSVLLGFSLFLFHSAIAQSGSQTTAPCVLGYTVGFFNGVWNTEYQAENSLFAVEDAVLEATHATDDNYAQEDVAYTVFYNHTGDSTSSGTTVGNDLEDIAEVFEQRANALDPSGNLATDAFYMFWETIGDTTQFHQSLTAVSSEFASLYSTFINDEIAAAAAEIASELASPPTADDYATQQAQLTSEASTGRKLLLVAHSQGNLFAYKGYDFILPTVSASRVNVVHIAPASPPSALRGPYTLSTLDGVINGLRLVGGASSVPMNNATIPFSTADPSGHELIATYLATDPARRTGRDKVEGQLLSGLASLTVSSNCDANISPSTNSLSAGGSASLTATVAQPIADAALTTLYRWTAGDGVFTGNGSGSGSSTYTSLTPDVIYTAAGTSVPGSSDTLKVSILVATDPNDLATSKQIGSGTATVNVQGAGLQGVISNGQLLTGTITGGSPPGSAATTWTFSTTSTGFVCASLDYAFPYKFGLSVDIDDHLGGERNCTVLAPGNHTLSIPAITYGSPTDMMTYTLKLVVDDESSGIINKLATGVTYNGQAVGPHYDVLSFKGTAGDAVTLTMINSGNIGVEYPFPFSNYLTVFDPDHNTLDGADGDPVKSTVKFVLPKTGTYVVFAGDSLPLIDIVTGYTLTINGLSGSS